jgi:hypothetical protein
MRQIKIFFSCTPDSEKDKQFILALEDHLADQTHDGEVEIWHIHKATSGTNVQQEILTHLERADIILIFVSRDYMTNRFCVDVEGAQAASMQSWNIATVRVLLIRPIDYRTAPFNFCQTLPKSGEFISQSRHKKEEVLHNIALDIYTLVKEAQGNRTEREAKRIRYRPALQQAYYMPVMAPVESLIKTRQTDDTKLNRLEKKTDEIKLSKRTEDLKSRKTNSRPKQRASILADSTTSSEYASASKIQSIIKAQKRRQAGIREVRSTYKPRTTNKPNWLNEANKEYKFFNKVLHRRLFFFLMILADSFGIAIAISGWSNSLTLSGLALFISLPIVVIGAVNTATLLPIPLAVGYAITWGIFIDHFFPSLKLIYLIGSMAVIAFIHFFLFHKNSR